MIDLEIIEPADSELDFYEGENKSVSYYLKNNTDFAVRDIDFIVKTIKTNGDETEKTYAKVGDIPKVILAGKKSEIRVKVSIPTTYGEYIMKDDVKKLSPFRLVVFANGTKYIGE